MFIDNYKVEIVYHAREIFGIRGRYIIVFEGERVGVSGARRFIFALVQELEGMANVLDMLILPLDGTFREEGQSYVLSDGTTTTASLVVDDGFIMELEVETQLDDGSLHVESATFVAEYF